MPIVSLKVDVTSLLPPEVVGGEPQHVGAAVFLPDRPASTRLPSCVISLLNGGSYDKRYFDVRISGHEGYSMAEFLRERGYVVVLTDIFGVGDSSRPANQMLVSRQVAAAANHGALMQIFDLLRVGELHASIPPMCDFLTVGGGHSMRGMITITQQAAHRTFSHLLVLGYTAIGVHLMRDWQLVSAHGPHDLEGSPFLHHDRSALRSTFHWDTVHPDMLAADGALQVGAPTRLSGEARMANIVAGDAATIEVPVFIGL